MNPSGGPALPVSIVSSELTEGGVAIPVYGYASTPSDRPVEAGPARRVKVITSSDLVANGGTYRLDGRPYAVPVCTAPSDMPVLGEPPLVVYSVNEDTWPVVPEPPWWDANGAVTTALAAYRAKGADSLSASYVNLVNPGVHDLTLGVAPGFDANRGWLFTGSQHLVTDIVPGLLYSAIVQYANQVAATQGYLCGASNAAGTAIFGLMSSRSSGFFRYYNTNFQVSQVGPTASGNRAVTNKGYYNGASDTAGNTTPTANVPVAMFIGAYNANGTIAQRFRGDIIAVAFYTSLLLVTDVATIAAAMAAL